MFIEKCASQASIGKRSLIFGVGTNDADYIIEPDKSNRKNRCPYYSRWHSMMTRCYSPKFLSENKTYDGCFVSSDWLRFSSFKSWMENQAWKGFALDKDLIKPLNKKYSAEFCCFIPQKLNNILCDHKAKRGPHPKGVSFDKSRSLYTSKISIDGKTVNLGRFEDVHEAEIEYLLAKIEYIDECSWLIESPEIINGLKLHAHMIKSRISKLEIQHNVKS